MTCFENIPAELKTLEQWVCASDVNKAPMCAYGYGWASTTQPDTWSDFETAREAVEAGYYEYCGYVFADNGYVGIDIDEGYDEDGFLSDLALDIMSKCKSYTERSKSGRGFHIIVKGDLPFKGRNNLQGVEIYKVARYFIITGNVLLYRDIVENQEAIDYVLTKYFPENTTMRSSKSAESKTIYEPIWDNAISKGKIKLRPTYPAIGEGSRNLCLTSLAGALHNAGYTKMQMFTELSYANKRACDPPLSENELQNICNSIVRYERR